MKLVNHINGTRLTMARFPPEGMQTIERYVVPGCPAGAPVVQIIRDENGPDVVEVYRDPGDCGLFTEWDGSPVEWDAAAKD